MPRTARKTAEQLANELHVRCGVTEPGHIDPTVAAKALGIEVTSGALPGATARVCRHGGRARIRVSDDIVQPGRRWFSIAHEIGHYLLGHAIAAEARLAEASTACSARPLHEERAADAFAVAYLMPRTMVRAHCRLSPADIAAARAIACRFGASPVASILRLVDLTSDPCAAVYSTDARVAWCKRNRRFPAKIPSGMPVDAHTVAACIARNPATQARELAASVWLRDGAAPERSTIVEHAEVIPEPGWGGVLSLLRWQPALPM